MTTTHTAMKVKLLKDDKDLMIELVTDYSIYALTLSQAALLQFHLKQLLDHVQNGDKK